MSRTSTRPVEQPVAALDRITTIATNVLLGALYVLFTYSAYQAWQTTGHFQMLLLAFQESLLIVLIITRRRSTDSSSSPWDWAIAFAGTAAPLLQQPGTPVEPLAPLGVGLQVAGIVLATAAVLSLQRSFGIVAANRGVRTDGLYRFVRHPLYGSYLVGYVGLLIGNLSVANVALIIASTLCQYLRAVAEERLLARDPAYQAYMERVRYRFIPYII